MPFYEMLPGGMPAGLQSDMDAVLNKKWGTSTTYQPQDWPETVNLMGPLPERTVSGSAVAFADGADTVPLKKCEVTIPANLDGVSSVDVMQTGRNLLEIDSSYDIPTRATTLTRDYSNNVLHIYGEIQDTNSNYYSQDITDLVREMGTITIIANTVSGGTADLSFRVNVQNGSTVVSRLAIGDTSRTITYTDGYTYLLMFFVSISATVGNTVDMTVNFEMDYGSSVGTYTPYVTPTIQTASLGRTIYGGTPDVVNGTGTETSKEIALSALTWTYDSTYSRFQSSAVSGIKIQTGRTLPMVCDNYTVIDDGRPIANVPDMSIYNSGNSGGFYVHDSRYTTVEDFIENMGSTIVCYPIATPEAFTFDPVPIDSRYGDNTIWSDSGDIEVTYRRDIALALAQ